MSNNGDLVYRPTGLKVHLLAHGLISEKLFFQKKLKNSPFSVISPWAFTRDYTVQKPSTRDLMHRLLCNDLEYTIINITESHCRDAYDQTVT